MENSVLTIINCLRFYLEINMLYYIVQYLLNIITSNISAPPDAYDHRDVVAVICVVIKYITTAENHLLAIHARLIEYTQIRCDIFTA